MLGKYVLHGDNFDQLFADFFNLIIQLQFAMWYADLHALGILTLYSICVIVLDVAFRGVRGATSHFLAGR